MKKVSANITEKFLKQFPNGKIEEPLKPYTSFKIGGPAGLFIKLTDDKTLNDLLRFIKTENIPYLILGGGCNTLIDSKGFDGLVIKMDLKKISSDIENELIAGAGTPISTLINESIRLGLTGLEKWMGLPGSVGGAIRGNAGYLGLETKDILLKAEIFDPQTLKTAEYSNSDLQFSYRTSAIKQSDKIVLSGTFKLKKSDITLEEQNKIIEESKNFRIQKQPPGFSAGSFFKNPSTDQPAGLLIDQCGLKGKELGGAKISEKHANFFINTGTATFEDILSLARLAKSEVQKKFGITLEEEVQIISKNGKISL